MATKYCSVPSCSNSSLKNPNKIFIRIPQIPHLRKLWYEKIRQPKVLISLGYVCEDHFNLQNDTENWLEYKMVGKRLLMKRHILPHLNLGCKPGDVFKPQIPSPPLPKFRNQNRAVYTNRRKIPKLTIEHINTDVRDTELGKSTNSEQKDPLRTSNDVAVQATVGKRTFSTQTDMGSQTSNNINTSVSKK